MKLKSLMAVAIAVSAPAVSLAGTWSSCQTITAVTDYLANNNAVYVILSPGISACHSDAPGSVIFTVGQMNVTSSNINSLTASLLSAYVSGKQVMIYYDETTAPACYSQVVSIGGMTGNCN